MGRKSVPQWLKPTVIFAAFAAQLKVVPFQNADGGAMQLQNCRPSVFTSNEGIDVDQSTIETGKHPLVIHRHLN